jgi:hypothetical protein
MDSKNPRPPDPRREPDDDDDDLTTDITTRDEIGFPTKPKLRLEASGSAPPAPELGPDDRTLIVRRSSAGLTAAAVPRTVRAWLEVRSGPAASDAPFQITMVKTLIGRGHQADIRVRDGRLSRKHATIFFTGTEFRIRDEASGNGTLLNGSRVVEYCVKDGDEIAAGSSVFCFRAELVSGRRAESLAPGDDQGVPKK